MSVGFETDIRPLFRPKDVSVMLAVRGLDLSSYEDVKANAEMIYERVDRGDMPCDGAWPETHVNLFRSWIDSGLNP